MLQGALLSIRSEAKHAPLIANRKHAFPNCTACMQVLLGELKRRLAEGVNAQVLQKHAHISTINTSFNQRASRRQLMPASHTLRGRRLLKKRQPHSHISVERVHQQKLYNKELFGHVVQRAQRQTEIARQVTTNLQT